MAKETENKEPLLSEAEKQQKAMEAQLKKEADEKASLPQVDAAVPKDEKVVKQPSPKQFKGRYIKASDGLPYAMTKVPEHPLGRTVKCMNSDKFWEGTPEEFKAQFDAA